MKLLMLFFLLQNKNKVNMENLTSALFLVVKSEKGCFFFFHIVCLVTNFIVTMTCFDSIFLSHFWVHE